MGESIDHVAASSSVAPTITPDFDATGESEASLSADQPVAPAVASDLEQEEADPRVDIVLDGVPPPVSDEGVEQVDDIESASAPPRHDCDNDDAEASFGSEVPDGDHRTGGAGGVDNVFDGDQPLGPSRYRCPITDQLGILAGYWLALHKAYQAGVNRIKHVAYDDLAEYLDGANDRAKEQRDEIGKLLTKTLKKHPVYPWLKAHRGAPKAVHTARLIAIIGDPLRFPGRACERAKGRHYLPQDYEGDTCPVLVYNSEGDAEVCGEEVGPLRRGCGRRSLRHYIGMHVTADGKFPRKRKGHQCDWNPEARGAILLPDVGIAAQLIRQKVEPYYPDYLAIKERLTRERGVGRSSDSDDVDGPASPANDNGGGVEFRYDSELRTGLAADNLNGVEVQGAGVVGDGSVPSNNGGGVEGCRDSEDKIGLAAEDSGRVDPSRGSEPSDGASQDGREGVERSHDSERGSGPLRPFQIDGIARKRIGSRFVEDMMLEWKRIVLAEGARDE